MFRKSILLVLGLALVAVVGANFMRGQEKTEGDKQPSKHEADKKAIEQLVKDLIKAFNSKDAAAMASHWTEDGEFIRNDGDAVEGREEIEKGYADYFKSLKTNPKVEVEFDNLRFPSANTAISEVTLRLKNDEGELVGSAWRNTLLVKEGGKWKIAIVRAHWDLASLRKEARSDSRLRMGRTQDVHSRQIHGQGER
jgi:uncharacterized protein (TIGR02246 family)